MSPSPLPPAVIPRMYSLVQVLLSFLPQVLLVLALAGALVLLWRWPRARLILSVLVLASLAIVGIVQWRASARRGQLGLTPASGPAASWTTFMGNARRSGRVASGEAIEPAGPPGPAAGKKLWSFRDGLSRAAFAGSAAVAGGRVYVGCDNRCLYCLDAADGRVLWKFKADCSIFAAPVVAEGRVWLGEGLHEDRNARLRCLDADTGKPIWDFATASHIEFGPTLAGGRLYFGAGDDGVYCLDAATGEKLWQHGGIHVDASPAVVDDAVFFGSLYGEPAFYRLDAASGRVVWRTPAPLGVCGSPSSDGRRVCFGCGNGTFEASHAAPAGGVWCLDARDGRVLWTTPFVKDAVLTTVALDQGRAYFGSRDGRVYCVDAESGKLQWSFAPGEPVLSGPAADGPWVYVGCNDGHVYCLRAATGEKLWGFDASAEAFNTDARILASPAVSEGGVYVGCMNFLFFCLGRQ